MTFTKDELKQELRSFMVGLACSAERVFGSGRGGALLGHPGHWAHQIDPTEAQLDDAWLWQSVLTMYDYGIEGRPHPAFGAGGDLGNQYGEAELFLLGLDSLALFLEEDDVTSPRLSKRTVRTAIARHLLDGGERYATRDEDERVGYLSFAEVALLADMDERSVRNAANPKQADALVTKNFGRRTMIHIDDARKWLAGRKGFVPTQSVAVGPAPEASKWPELSVPYPLLARLHDQAETAGIPTWELLERLLDQSPTGNVQ